MVPAIYLVSQAKTGLSALALKLHLGVNYPTAWLISLDARGNPEYVKLTPMAAFTREAVGQWSAAHLQPGTILLNDGLNCFVGVVDRGCDPLTVVVSRRKPRDLPEFAWINTVLGNLKTTLAGAHHAFKYGVRGALLRRLRLPVQPALRAEACGDATRCRRRVLPAAQRADHSAG